jgi:hypothetical protein
MFGFLIIQINGDARSPWLPQRLRIRAVKALPLS